MMAPTQISLILMGAFVAIAGCSNPPKDTIKCGLPGKMWVPVETLGPRHQIIENMIEVKHTNLIEANEKTVTLEQLKPFLVDIRERQFRPLNYFDFDAHANCDVVINVRKLVEASGVCKTGTCVTGNDFETPP